MQRKLDGTTWIFIAVGGLFLVVGLILGLIVPQALTKEAVRAERLRPLSVSELDAQAAGSEVMLEGRVSSTNPLISQTFVAYIGEVYRGTDENDYPKWEKLETVTPPIQLDIDTSRVQIINQDYALDGQLKAWQESDELHYSAVRNQGTLRQRGLERGSAVMVIGKAQPGAEGMAIEAAVLYSGKRADYIANYRDVAFWMRWAGLALGGAGVLILGFVFLYRGRQ